MEKTSDNSHNEQEVIQDSHGRDIPDKPSHHIPGMPTISELRLRAQQRANKK
jgi:hypothetical protein